MTLYSLNQTIFPYRGDFGKSALTQFNGLVTGAVRWDWTNGMNCVLGGMSEIITMSQNSLQQSTTTPDLRPIGPVVSSR